MEEKSKKIYGIRKDIVFMYIALIVLGLVFLVFPEVSTVKLSYFIAGALVILGGLRLRSYFMASRFTMFGSYGLVEGGLLILAGGAIFVEPQMLAEVLMVIVGIVVVADGLLKVQYTVDLLRIRGDLWWILGILSLLMIGAGVLIILNPFDSATSLMRFSGIFLILNGIIDIAAIIYISKKIQLLRDAMDQDEEETKYIEE